MITQIYILYNAPSVEILDLYLHNVVHLYLLRTSILPDLGNVKCDMRLLINPWYGTDTN